MGDQDLSQKLMWRKKYDENSRGLGTRRESCKTGLSIFDDFGLRNRLTQKTK